MNFFNNPYVSDGHALAHKGMSMVRPIEVLPTQVLYRFYDSNRCKTAADGASGAWWFEYDHFQTIKHFAMRNGYTFSYAARLFAAILYEFSEVDAWVSCEITQPLRAWKGRGKQVESSGKDSRDGAMGTKMTPMQGISEVYQIYLPGLGGMASISTSVLKVKDSGSL